MKPITFQCQKHIPHTGEEICNAIANVDAWSQFGGYGVLPGIQSATYDKRTDNMLGSRIRVRNTDGSGHVEEIYRWVPGQAVAMKFQEFTPPLSRLASHFTEEWSLQPTTGGTDVTRRFQLVATSSLTRPFLWLISLLFRRAIDRHLDDMARM